MGTGISAVVVPLLPTGAHSTAGTANAVWHSQTADPGFVLDSPGSASFRDAFLRINRLTSAIRSCLNPPAYPRSFLPGLPLPTLHNLAHPETESTGIGGQLHEVEPTLAAFNLADRREPPTSTPGSGC